MKNQPSRKISFLCLFGLSNLLSHTHVYAQAPTQVVTAAEYCAFLNQNAARDPNHLFDEKMETEPEAACILRLGAPGKFHYQVIAGRENFPVCYVNTVAENSYCNETGDVISDDDENADPSLRYNLRTFAIDTSPSPAVTLATTPISHLPSSISYFNDAVGVAVLIGLATFGSVGMVGGDAIEAREPILADAEQRPSEAFAASPHATIIRQGVENLTLRDNTAARYNIVDDLWTQREESWESHAQALQTLQEKTDNLTLAEARERETKQADHNRDENQLGRLKQRLEQLSGILHDVPEPHTQIVATGVDTVASAAGWINKIWTKANLAQAMALKKISEQAHEQAQESSDQANVAAVRSERQAAQGEEKAMIQERANIERLANSFRPRSSWGENDWQAWSRELLNTTQEAAGEEKVFTLAEQSRENIDWVTQQTAKAWQKRLQQSQKNIDLLKQESKKVITPLQYALLQEEQILQRAIGKKDQAATRLQAASAQQQNLKQQIEQFLESCQQGDQWDQRRINGNRENFCADFERLITTSRSIDRYEKECQQALEEYQKQGRQRLLASQQLESQEKKYQRLLHRAQTSLQANQEQFSNHWPEYDLTYRPYLTWELPFAQSTVEQATEHSFQDDGNETKSAAIIDPPLILQKNLKALGRRYFHQVKTAIDAAWDPVPQSQLSSIKEVSSSEKASAIPLFEQKTSALSPYEELRDWSFQRLEQTLLDEEQEGEQHWKARRQLNDLHQKTHKLARLLKQQTETDQSDTASSFSWRTSNTKAKKAPSLLSYFSTDARSTTMAPEKSYELGSLQEQFEQAYAAEEEARDQWIQLITVAEKERVAQGGTAFEDKREDAAISAAAINAWAEVDDEILKEQQQRNKISQEKKDAAAMEQSWRDNNRRWEARAHAYKTEKRIEELEQQQRHLSTRTDLREAERLQQERELENKLIAARVEAQEASQIWEEQAREHALRTQDGEDIIKRIEKLKIFDQAVVKRWDQFQEKQDPLDPEKTAAQQQEDYGIDLGIKLNEEENNAFKTTPITEEEIKKYQQAANSEALRAARENIVGNQAAWDERIRQGKRKLQEDEERAINAATSEQEKRRLRDLLPQLRAVTQADQRAQRIFEKEKCRLDRIEGIWNSIQEAQQKEKTHRAREAAELYHQGNKSLWEQLFEQERQDYNDQIAKENQHHHQELASEEGFLEEIKSQLQKEQKRATQIFSRFVGSITGQQKTALDLLQHAQHYYEGRYQDLVQRKKDIRWAGMTLEQRETEFLQPEVEELRIQREKTILLAQDARRKAAALKKNSSPQAVALSKSADLLETVVNDLKKTSSAISSRQLKLAYLWKKSATQRQLLSNHYTKAAEAYASGDEAAAERWNRAAKAAEAAANRLGSASSLTEKAVAAEASGKPVIADLYSQAAKGAVVASNHYTKAAEAYASGDEATAERWDKAATAAGAAADRLGGNDGFAGAATCTEKASEAAVSGKPEIADLWTQVARGALALSNHYTKAAEAYASGDEATAERWDKAATAAGAAAKSLLWGAAVPLRKADEATASGSEKAAELWNKAVGQYQSAADYYMQRAKALAEGDEKKAERLEKAAKAAKQATDLLDGSYYGAATSLIKADEATASGNEKAAELWNKAVGQYQSAADYYMQQAEALAEGDEKKAERLEKAAMVAEKATDLLDGSSDRDGLAHLLIKADKATASRDRDEKKADEATASRDSNEKRAERLEKAAMVAKIDGSYSGDGLAVLLSEAAAATASRNRDEEEAAAATASRDSNEKRAELWNKAAGQHQSAADYYLQQAKVVAEEDEKKTEWLGKAVEAAKNAAEYTGIAASKIKIHDRYNEYPNKVASHYQSAADYYMEQAEALSRGDKEKAEQLTRVTNLFQNALNFYSRASYFQEEYHEHWTPYNDDDNYADIGHGYRNAAKAAEHAADLLAGFRRDYERRSYGAVISLIEANKATAAGDEKAVKLWNEAVGRYQNAADYYMQRAEALAKRNEKKAEEYRKQAEQVEEDAKNAQRKAQGLGCIIS